MYASLKMFIANEKTLIHATVPISTENLLQWKRYALIHFGCVTELLIVTMNLMK